MEETIIKELVSVIIAGLVMYIGFINSLRSDVKLLKKSVSDLEEKCKEVNDKMDDQEHLNTILEEKVKNMESRQDSHSKKYDELMSTINELKIEMVRQFSRLTSELNAFNSMVEASDKGVKVNKRKK